MTEGNHTTSSPERNPGEINLKGNTATDLLRFCVHVAEPVSSKLTGALGNIFVEIVRAESGRPARADRLRRAIEYLGAVMGEVDAPQREVA